MSAVNTVQTPCASCDLAAYLDGELDAASCAELEEHLLVCAGCAEKLREQKRLLCALDMALHDEDELLALPANFAEVIAAHAQSDMSGISERSEHKRALKMSLMLAAAAVLLLGIAAMSESVLGPIGAVARPFASLAGFIWRMLYNAGAGLVVVSRVAGHLLFNARPLGLLGGLILAAALALLPRLIISYHRTRIT